MDGGGIDEDAADADEDEVAWTGDRSVLLSRSIRLLAIWGGGSSSGILLCDGWAMTGEGSRVVF